MAGRRFNPKTFVDSLRVYVKGGTGGKGLLRYGGIGGRGGSVYVECDPGVRLKDLRTVNPNLRFIAGVGDDSRRACLIGSPGQDITFPVPSGVIVKLDSGRILGELNEKGDKVLVAKGGEGASKRNRFIQQKGHMLNITLDLKLIADIGLVGFPNAGKSTVMSALSRAAPKVAAYPFTTIQPSIGTMEYSDTRQITIADLPGLIEGAHINIGMGHKFLKHVERTKILLFMVDLMGFRLKVDTPLRTPFETIVLLIKELELYKEELLNKPKVLVLNKIDVEGCQKIAEEVTHKVEFMQDYITTEIAEPLWPKNPVEFENIHVISARDKLYTEDLKLSLRQTLDRLADEQFDKENPKNYEEFEAKLAHALTEHHTGKPLI